MGLELALGVGLESPLAWFDLDVKMVWEPVVVHEGQMGGVWLERSVLLVDGFWKRWDQSGSILGSMASRLLLEKRGGKAELIFCCSFDVGTKFVILHSSPQLGLDELLRKVYEICMFLHFSLTPFLSLDRTPYEADGEPTYSFPSHQSRPSPYPLKHTSCPRYVINPFRPSPCANRYRAISSSAQHSPCPIPPSLLNSLPPPLAPPGRRRRRDEKPFPHSGDADQLFPLRIETTNPHGECQCLVHTYTDLSSSRVGRPSCSPRHTIPCIMHPSAGPHIHLCFHNPSHLCLKSPLPIHHVKCQTF